MSTFRYISVISITIIKGHDPGHLNMVLCQIISSRDNVISLTLSQRTNFKLFKTFQKFTDYNSKFDENSRKYFKQVENTVGNGEIARYEQFLLFSQCFQNTSTADPKLEALERLYRSTGLFL